MYSEEQPDEDLIHNLEHGHVWISYNPNLISGDDLEALEQFVRDGSTEANGGGVGVILTPRAANTSAIAVASWARLLELDGFDATTPSQLCRIEPWQGSGRIHYSLELPEVASLILLPFDGGDPVGPLESATRQISLPPFGGRSEAFCDSCG